TAGDFDHPKLAEGHPLRRHVLYRATREERKRSMYLPKHFVPKEDAALDLMDEYPFATVISCANDAPTISHLPLLLDRSRNRLVGHMARANGHWRVIQEKPQTTVLFHGPHTYITPTWYMSGRDVPTWNYAVVHVVGRAKLIEDFDGLMTLLQK